MNANASAQQFVPAKRLIVVVDLASYAKAFQSHTDEQMASLVQEYYIDCDRVFTANGGTIIKFIGDACLAVFPPELAVQAIDAVKNLQVRIREIARQHQVDIGLGANLHTGSVIEGQFGSGSNQRTDVLGRAVNQTFLLGRGAGIRISEPVYRTLPSGARSHWRKHKPPAVYHFGAGPEGILEAMGKDPAANAARW